MRVTTKGQVTIPEEIRDRLGIGPGSEVEFLATEDGVRFVAVSETFPKKRLPVDSAGYSIIWPGRWIWEA
jgi:AbrB family looped-hinge helix DNA binding protein